MHSNDFGASLLGMHLQTKLGLYIPDQNDEYKNRPTEDEDWENKN